MLSRARADELARALDLDPEGPEVRPLCLLLVCPALERGDEREIRRTVRAVAPGLWQDGLERPARLALERARRRGVPDAETALAEIEAHGGRSRAVQAIVRRLAADLLRRIDARWNLGNGARRPGSRR